MTTFFVVSGPKVSLCPFATLGKSLCTFSAQKDIFPSVILADVAGHDPRLGRGHTRGNLMDLNILRFPKTYVGKHGGVDGKHEFKGKRRNKRELCWQFANIEDADILLLFVSLFCVYS